MGSIEQFAAADADIRTISVKKLFEGDATAAEDLYLAAKDSGFFYLDCTGHLDGALLERVDAVHEAHKATCDLPLEEKMKYFADVDHKDGELVVIGYVKIFLTSFFILLGLSWISWCCLVE